MMRAPPTPVLGGCHVASQERSWCGGAAVPSLRDAPQPGQTNAYAHSPPRSCSPHSWDAPAVLIKCCVWWLIKEKTVILFLSGLRTPHYFYCSNNIAEHFIVFEFGIASESGRTSRTGLGDQSLPSKGTSLQHQGPTCLRPPPPPRPLQLHPPRGILLII